MRQYVSVVQIMIFPSSSYIMLQRFTSESSLTMVLGTYRKLIDIYDLSTEYGQELCTALMSFHVFTHCDKQVHLRVLGTFNQWNCCWQTKAFQDALSKSGDSWEVSAEEFTTTMNGRGMYKSVSAAHLGKSAQGKVWWHRWSPKALQKHIRHRKSDN